MNVIEVEGISKSYGATRAVDDVSFSVAEGEIFGIVGPNGAGKTTTVEAVAGLRGVDAGRISVLGLDPIAEGRALRQRLGIQLQDAASKTASGSGKRSICTRPSTSAPPTKMS